jgi:uncharacterized membrane protein
MKNQKLEDLGKLRIETLSDGIFAIVLTLLVLEIKVPHINHLTDSTELFLAVSQMLPKFISWVISFLTVCVIWLNHHRLFSNLGKIDGGMFWRNANLLLWCSFIPFPTALMGDYPSNSIAVSLYGMVMLLMALAFVFLRSYALKHEEILHKECNRLEFKTGTKWSILMGPVAYGIATSLAWVEPIVSMIIYAGIAMYFVFPHSISMKSE